MNKKTRADLLNHVCDKKVWRRIFEIKLGTMSGERWIKTKSGKYWGIVFNYNIDLYAWVRIGQGQFRRKWEFNLHQWWASVVVSVWSLLSLLSCTKNDIQHDRFYCYAGLCRKFGWFIWSVEIDMWLMRILGHWVLHMWHFGIEEVLLPLFLGPIGVIEYKINAAELAW